LVVEIARFPYTTVSWAATSCRFVSYETKKNARQSRRWSPGSVTDAEAAGVLVIAGDRQEGLLTAVRGRLLQSAQRG
jgi:hypothetical protein